VRPGHLVPKLPDMAKALGTVALVAFDFGARSFGSLRLDAVDVMRPAVCTFLVRIRN